MTRATVLELFAGTGAQDEVIARLKAADKLFGFPEAAKCQVESANAFAVDSQGKITKNDGNMQAMYRFSCDAAGAKSLDRIKTDVRNLSDAARSRGA